MKRLILMATLASIAAFAQTPATGSAQPQGSTPSKPVAKKHTNKKSKKSAKPNPAGSTAPAPAVKK